MVEVLLLIPLTDNGKVSFTEHELLQFERFARDRLGGVSRLPGILQGHWLDDDGGPDEDKLLVYLLAVEGLIGKGVVLREVVDFARAHFRQKAIYLRYLGVAEIL